MRWIGLHDGYVSSDGRFWVTQVVVRSKNRSTTRWVVYGAVRVTSEDPQTCCWQWTQQPLFGPVATKRACQKWALASDYEPAQVTQGASEALATPPKSIGWEVCQECGVDFPRPKDHPYLDYCGKGCFEVVGERVDEIRAGLRTRRAS